MRSKHDADDDDDIEMALDRQTLLINADGVGGGNSSSLNSDQYGSTHGEGGDSKHKGNNVDVDDDDDGDDDDDDDALNGALDGVGVGAFHYLLTALLGMGNVADAVEVNAIG
jgi:hypothetical protein